MMGAPAQAIDLHAPLYPEIDVMSRWRISRTLRTGAIVACLLSTVPAHADGWHDEDGGGGVGFIAGLVTGAIAAPFFAPRVAPVYAPPPVAYVPAPAYGYAPPPPPATYLPAAPAYGWAPAPAYRWRREHDDRRGWRRDDDR